MGAHGIYYINQSKELASVLVFFGGQQLRLRASVVVEPTQSARTCGSDAGPLNDFVCVCENT